MSEVFLPHTLSLKMILNVPELVVQDISDLNLCHDVHHFPHRGVRVDDLAACQRMPVSVVLGVDCLLHIHNDDHVRPNVAFNRLMNYA